MSSPPFIKQALSRARLDWTPIFQPASTMRTVLASVLSVVAALAANAGLVRIAASSSPSIKDYSHFRFIDYGSLTVLGVVGAGVAWFVVSRISSSPRWFFLRLAVVVTVVFWVPDSWLIARHEPIRAVLVLMVMHLVMALLTYNILVHAAPVRARTFDIEVVPAEWLAVAQSTGSPRTRTETTKRPIDARFGRGTWLAMTVAVGIEFLVGLGEFFFVPYNRPDGFIATNGEAISLVHALVGGFLGIGATAIVLLTACEDRPTRAAAMGGFIGVMLGAAGGTLSYDHSLRILGMGLMFVGASVASICYLIPLIGDSMYTPKSTQ